MPLGSAYQRQCDLTRARRILAFPAQQEPSPLEMMPWFQHPAVESRHRLPFLVEEFTQTAALCIDEVRQSEPDNLTCKLQPCVVVADLCPGEAGFQQVHVRVRLQWQLRRVCGTKARCVVALQRAHHSEPQAIGLFFWIDVAELESRRRCQSQQRERLVIKQRAIVKNRAVRRSQRSEQPIGPTVAAEKEFQSLKD